MTASPDLDLLQRNKRIVRRFFEWWNERGMVAALETCAPECRWQTATGAMSREQVSGAIRTLLTHLAEPLLFEVGAMTAEEDRVAVEARSRALRSNGVRYANTYHFLFKVAEDRIIEVHEHCDTAHAAAVWGDLG